MDLQTLWLVLLELVWQFLVFSRWYFFLASLPDTFLVQDEMSAVWGTDRNTGHAIEKNRSNTPQVVFQPTRFPNKRKRNIGTKIEINKGEEQ